MDQPMAPPSHANAATAAITLRHASPPGGRGLASRDMSAQSPSFLVGSSSSSSITAAGPPAHARGHRRLRRCPISRSEEHTSELQSLMRISYAVFCLKKKKKQNTT